MFSVLSVVFFLPYAQQKENVILILAGAGVGMITPFVTLMLLSAGHSVAGSVTGGALLIGTLLASPWQTEKGVRSH